MRVQVERFGRIREATPITLEAEPGAWSLDLPIEGSVQVHGRLLQDAEDVTVSLVAKGNARFHCSRCLAEYIEPFEAEIEQRFRLDAKGTENGDEEVLQVEEDTIDLGPLLAEAIYLALPSRPLCDEHCLGLCPVCGQNQNNARCACSQESIDPRLEILRTLISPEEGKETT